MRHYRHILERFREGRYDVSYGLIERMMASFSRFFPGFLLILLLGSCGALSGDSCTDPSDGRCKDGFFSAKRQRSVLYGGDVSSLLYTGEAVPTGGQLNLAHLNGPPPKVVPFVGYVDNVRMDFSPTPDGVQQDLVNLQSAGGKPFDPEAKVNIGFNKASLSYVLKQLLGGALGVNYIAPDDLGGAVTFRTEEPVLKSQVLYIVRDILARNGLAMQFVNGVYHIGQPEMIANLAANARQYQASDLTTHVVRLEKNNAPNVIHIASQLLPAGITLMPSNVSNAIIVRAPAHDIAQVENTLKSISRDGLGDEHVSVVPVHNSAPEKIAAKLIAFYQARIPAGGELPTIVPLERQRALLVAARDKQVMNGMKQLAQLMDRESADEPMLRVIELRHLSAEEIEKPLTKIFSKDFSANGAGNDSISALNTPGLQSSLAPGSLGAEELSHAGLSSDARAGELAAKGALAEAANVGQVRIVADARTNTLMVYSNYADFQRIRDVLAAIDIPQSQLVLEAMIVEVKLNDHLEHGVQMYLQGPHIGARSGGGNLPIGSDNNMPIGKSDNGSLIALGGNIGNYRVEAILSALQAITQVKVISSPYLTVLDGKTARLVVGDQIPYAMTSQQSQNAGNVTITKQIQVKDTGVVLDVTPRIYSSNSVALRINQSVSTPSQVVQNENPIISTRQVESNILGQSGRTIVLGGLIQDRYERTETGVPLLKEAPILGELFKTRNDRVSRVELLILLTPRVVRSSAQIEDITRLLKSKLHTR